MNEFRFMDSKKPVTPTLRIFCLRFSKSMDVRVNHAHSDLKVQYQNACYERFKKYHTGRFQETLHRTHSKIFEKPRSDIFKEFRNTSLKKVAGLFF